MTLTLAENFRAIFYTPFYLLKTLGLAEQAGLAITWLPPGLPGGAIDAVKQGTVDVTWGGPMRVLKDHDTTPSNEQSLLCVGEVVSRDPFFLVGKRSLGHFDLAHLNHLRLAQVTEVPTPWLCLQADLRDQGLEVEKIEASLVRGLTMPEQLQALKTDTLDVAQLFEPLVSALLTDPAYQVLYAAHTRGPTVYTTLICSRAGWHTHQQALTVLCNVLHTTQTWMHAQTPATIANHVQPFFPECDALHLEHAIARYLNNNVWATSPKMSQIGFDRLAMSLHSGHFIRSRMDFAACITPLDQTND